MKSLYYNFFMTLFVLSAVTPVNASTSDTAKMKLDDVLQIVATIKSRPTMDNSQQFSKITAWVNGISTEVKTISGRDLTGVARQFTGQFFHTLGKRTFSDQKDLILDYGEDVGFLENGFVLQTGNCDFGHVNNSVIICTGDLHISHSNNNIVIANGEIDIAHDGSGPEQLGSIIYNRKMVEIAHSSSSVILFSPQIEISHVKNSSCINTGKFYASHGQCNNIKSSHLTENLTARSIAGLEIRQPVTKKLKPNTREISEDPLQAAEFFCHALKQFRFDYAKTFLDDSLLENFHKRTTKIQGDLKKETKKAKIMKKFNKWSCEVLHTQTRMDDLVSVTLGGFGEVRLKNESDEWKIVKY